MTTDTPTGPVAGTTAPPRRARAMLTSRHSDTARRRQRVATAIEHARPNEISVSRSAKAAAVDRSFLYRHRDLLETIHALTAETPPATPTGPTVSRTSLQADLLAAHERAARLDTRIRHLEKRLSDLLGEQAWHDSGLATPADLDTLHHRISDLEQQIVDLRSQLDERDDDLAAARAANRDLMTRINTPSR